MIMLPTLLIISILGNSLVDGASNNNNDLLLEPTKIENNTLLYFTKLYLILVGGEGEANTRRNVSLTYGIGKSVFNDTEGEVEILATGTSPEITLTTFSMSLFVKLLMKQYWSVTNLTVTAEGKVSKGNVTEQPFAFKNLWFIPPVELTAPLKMSFHCTRYGPWVAAIPKDASAKTGIFAPQLEFRNFQMESFMKNTTKFGQSYDCVGFFSIGILSGIFVTIILLSILTWGVSMVMSVKTMDRFDDPKSKPISVGTSD